MARDTVATEMASFVSRFLAIACLAAATMLTGCADKRGGPIPYAPSDFGTPDAPSVASLDADYKIAPMDTLAVRVFRMADLTGDYEVDLAGKISMPLIGEIRAVDMTTAQLDSELTRRLGEKYLESPDVSVGIKSSTSRVVTVDGAVNKSGAYPAIGPLSLMQAVALAGGLSPDANARRVAIFRQINGRRQAAAFDLTSIRRGEMADPRIFAGDIVVVDGSSVKAATKQILNSMPLLSIFRPF
ncbi:MAG TPA: polysaccharide biosynthesis/export family protein [Sphingomicrobium sp.]|nr:polysaccharide biosynthesis/export family protein [Sphingomicrobium sp.]